MKKGKRESRRKEGTYKGRKEGRKGEETEEK